MSVCLPLSVLCRRGEGWLGACKARPDNDDTKMQKRRECAKWKWQSDAFYEVGNWEQGKGLAETTKCKKLMKQQHL